MSKWLKRIQAWRSRKEQRSLQRWEQVRAEGKAQFVRRTALTFGLTIVGATHLFDQVFLSGTNSSMSLSLLKLFFFVLFGFSMASDIWSKREAQYQNALTAARVKASPGGELPPQPALHEKSRF